MIYCKICSPRYVTNWQCLFLLGFFKIIHIVKTCKAVVFKQCLGELYLDFLNKKISCGWQPSLEYKLPAPIDVSLKHMVTGESWLC